MSTVKKSRGLGRGLESLLGADTSTTANAGTPTTLSVDVLQPGVYQPRTHMDEASLNALAQSIKEQGLMQPILVRVVDGNKFDNGKTEGVKYEIIAGERRWRASQIAGLTEVPVLVKDVPNENAAIMSLIENIQREDLNPLEEAQGIMRLIQDFGLTHDQAAGAVGRSRSATSNLLRLLNLCKPVQTMLVAGDIDMGHARALLSVDAATQVQLAQQVVQQQLSVRETEKLVSRTLNQTPKLARKIEKNNDSDSKRLAEKLSDALNAEVELHMTKGGKGKLIVQFKGLDVLQGIIEKLGIQEA